MNIRKLSYGGIMPQTVRENNKVKPVFWDE